MKILRDFVAQYGIKYSEMLNIDLNKEPFKWFLMAILFGAPIPEKIAIKTYKEFEKNNIISAEKILATSWEGLVAVLDSGGYVRYDFKTADKLLEVAKNLTTLYNGNLENLYKSAKNEKELEIMLKALGKGIGDITVSIFLREMKPIWNIKSTEPKGLVLIAMRNLGLKNLEKVAKNLKLDIVRLEVALLRLGRDFCRKNKCDICVFAKNCRKCVKNE